MNHLNMSDSEAELLSSNFEKFHIGKCRRGKLKHCVVFNLTATSSHNLSKTNLLW